MNGNSSSFIIITLVTSQTTNNRKAAIRKLSPAQMSLLVNQPDITLDKLHKIPNLHHKKTSMTQTRDTDKKSELEKDLIHMVSSLSFMMMSSKN